MGRGSDRTGDVGTDANTTATECEKGAFATSGAAGGVAVVVGIGAAAPERGGGFEGEEGYGESGFDVWYCTGFFEDPYHRAILRIRFSHITRIADADIESANSNGVFERDGYPGQRAFLVHLLCPCFCLGKHNLSETIGLCMGLDSDLSVGPEDIDRLENLLVDILDELFDGLLKDLAVLGGYGAQIR
jgi:hypothetical protein